MGVRHPQPGRLVSLVPQPPPRRLALSQGLRCPAASALAVETPASSEQEGWGEEARSPAPVPGLPGTLAPVPLAWPATWPLCPCRGPQLGARVCLRGSPKVLVERVRQRFVELGGTVLEDTELRGLDVYDNGVVRSRLIPMPDALVTPYSALGRNME